MKARSLPPTLLLTLCASIATAFAGDCPQDLSDAQAMAETWRVRDSSHTAEATYWREQAELASTKDSNWRQSWNELMAAQQDCARDLQEARMQAQCPTPPAPSAPSTEDSSVSWWSVLGGFAAGIVTMGALMWQF